MPSERHITFANETMPRSSHESPCASARGQTRIRMTSISSNTQTHGFQCLKSFSPQALTHPDSTKRSCVLWNEKTPYTNEKASSNSHTQSRQGWKSWALEEARKAAIGHCGVWDTPACLQKSSKISPGWPQSDSKTLQDCSNRVQIGFEMLRNR